METKITVSRADGSVVAATVPDEVGAVLDAYFKDNPQYSDIANWIYEGALGEFRDKILPNYAGVVPAVEKSAAELDAAKKKHAETVNGLLDLIKIEGE